MTLCDIEEIKSNNKKGYSAEELKNIIYALINSNISCNKEYNKVINKLSKGKSTIPSKSILSHHYQLMKKNKEIEKNLNIEKYIKCKKVRSESGVVIITIVMKPDKFSCPFNCHMCPNETIANGAKVDMPRSYLSTEPAEMRAQEVNFDTVLQFRSRMNTLESNGHEPDKAEIIVLGGTFSTYPRKYQEEFIRDIYYAANTYFKKDFNRTRGTIEEEQIINETNDCHIVGITLETRPDQINKAEINRFRKYGCTRVQLGVQHTDNNILDKINRMHYVEHSIKAIKLLKQYGFKVDIHIMPDLPGATPEIDKLMMEEIFTTENFQPDYLKIYPCLDVEYTEIRKWKENGIWKPYAEEDNCKKLIDVILHAKKMIPRWMRVNRVQRDFPPSNKNNDYIGYVSNTIRTNLRQIVLKELDKLGMSCQCIHCREIKDNYSNPLKAKLSIDEYNASDGKEYFISYNTVDDKYLYGFVRLRFNNDKTSGPFPKDNVALIRELHVYGNVERVNQKNSKDTVQHLGFGKKLVKEAERIAWDCGYDNIAIISAVGTRDYYRKLGYTLKDTYMVKELQNPHILLDISLIIVFYIFYFMVYKLLI